MLIPISHEENQARRWPWLTTLIVVANVLIALGTFGLMDRQQEQLNQLAEQAARYYVQHPYLNAGDLLICRSI